MASEDVLGQAARWRDEGYRVALATVVKTWGSSPRQAGSQLAIRHDSLFVGSVSGGCVEGKVVEAALEVMESGTPPGSSISASATRTRGRSVSPVGARSRSSSRPSNEARTSCRRSLAAFRRPQGACRFDDRPRLRRAGSLDARSRSITGEDLVSTFRQGAAGRSLPAGRARRPAALLPSVQSPAQAVLGRRRAHRAALGADGPGVGL